MAIAAAVHHVTLGMAVAAASRWFAGLLPTEPSWIDLVEVAYLLQPELGISQASWSEACEVLGRNGAALCVLVTDRAMINRGRAGELRLHSSVFVWIEAPSR